MKNVRLLSFVAALGIALGVTTTRADDSFVSTDQLAKDLDANGSLDTTVVPRFKFGADANADGVPDWITFWFNVYPIGTTTLLRSTVTKPIGIPAMPCADPQFANFKFRVKFGGLRNSPRVHVLIETGVDCQETGTSEFKEAFKTTVYSANASTGAGVWLYSVNRSAVGMDGVDTDGNGTNDALQILTSYAPAPDQENVVIRIVNPADGTVISNVDYPFSR